MSAREEAVQLCLYRLFLTRTRADRRQNSSWDGLGPTAVTPARRPLSRRRVHVDVRRSASCSRRLHERQTHRECQALVVRKPTSQSFPLGRPPTRESVQVPDRDDQLVEPRRRRTRRDPAGREPRPGRIGLARRSRTLLAHRKTEQRRVSPRLPRSPFLAVVSFRTRRLIPVHSVTQL